MNNYDYGQTFKVNLKTGSRVAILTDVNMDDDGFAASTVFEDTVKTYNPHTRLLVFEDSDIGYHKFKKMVYNHDSIQIIRE